MVISDGDDAVFFIELSATMIGTWFLNSTQLQDSESITLRQTQHQHSLQIRCVRDIYNGAEITFIASGVRDSAFLHVERKYSLNIGNVKWKDFRCTLEAECSCFKKTNDVLV